MKRRSRGKLGMCDCNSDKNIEKLKELFSKLGVTINSKWIDVEVMLKKDPIAQQVDPLDQIS